MNNRIIRKITAGALVLMLAVVGCQNVTEVADQDDLIENQVIEGQYIVVMKSSNDGQFKLGDVEQVEAVRSKVMSKAQLSETDVFLKYNNAIAGFAAHLDEAQLEKLRSDENVKYIEKDRIHTFAPPCGTPNGGSCDGDGGGSSNQETPYGITRVNGGVTYTGSSVAWIIDTGIDLDHPDLNVDASRGFNAFTSGRDAKSLDDGNGHGSHVAGTVAAVDNDQGVIGVAAGATVIPVKVLDSRGSGSYSGVIAGVDHVGANGSAGDVANMSLGGPVSQALDDAVLAASSNGIYFSLAAGNDSEDANNSSPARVNGTYIVTISAMDSNDDWAYFSNFGNPPVDYASPGVSVTSTWKDGGYNTISGTSMAAPHAAGVLLLGNASTDGTVNGDPDGNPDPIIVH
ncbi:MAG: S8 family peptidase [Gracilimonas sp.]|uniref:S8 family peptidase n=1 Tax=Gracilimonas sp. TaxID=1974203 RepID=UPI0019987D55|nr:S8 family peptidase [Gracilimonas sp.]MBD3616573.1 S8 family peptidase [Gracilimonas sp.]